MKLQKKRAVLPEDEEVEETGIEIVSCDLYKPDTYLLHNLDAGNEWGRKGEETGASQGGQREAESR
jgi:hypothetical protein